MEAPMSMFIDSGITQLFWIEATPEKQEVNKDETLLKIESFLTLPIGWDYGQGVPSTKNVTRKAKQIFSLAKLKGFSSEALPKTDGGIIMVLAKGEFFLDVVIKPDLTLDVRIEKGIGEEYEVLFEDEDVAKADVLNLLMHTKGLYSEWLSSALYTKENIAYPSTDSPQITSNLMVAEFQYSMEGALC